jgi:hypothetical protein
MTNEKSEPVCKDVTLNANRQVACMDSLRRCAVVKFHFNILSGKNENWTCVFTSTTHTGNNCDDRALWSF